MSKPALYGVGIFVPVSDLERSTTWYTEMLGFEITGRDEPRATVMMMNDHRIMFCLVKSYNIVQHAFPQNDYQVEQYFNFHTDDVKEAYRNLKDKGADIGEIVHYDDGISGFPLYDPDGNKYGVVK
ncbi:VOC family protein [Paenibacillus sp. CF384]|uniref:VOC family protein n=1 Tax=Paenibacillus sp. CF384 TaxID=1884382 RepID=UPI00089ADA6F|nr:VOC family protein [Paenibacillus sp. CF384]SDX58224.1 Catechol 2,3-dioxygenase [Paenibacillus sp. CF384]